MNSRPRFDTQISFFKDSRNTTIWSKAKCSLVPRPCPAFHRLQFRKAEPLSFRFFICVQGEPGNEARGVGQTGEVELAGTTSKNTSVPFSAGGGVNVSSSLAVKCRSPITRHT